MEQARYWMWAKRKHSNFISGGVANSHDVHLQLPSVHVDDSCWEEQAFAEDAAGPLGGCIWPPRSYSCSFCRREFRSAQALGGHMNVHRRDRARLKQSPSSHDQTVENSHHHHDSNDQSHRDISVQINPFSSSSLQGVQANSFHQYPSHHHQVCTLVYNPNNLTSSDDPSSPASASRVSAQLSAGTEKITLSTLPCSRSSPSPSTRSILTPNRYYTINNSASRNYTELAAEKISRVAESSGSCRANPGNDLSVSLSLVVRCGASPSVSADEDEEDEEAILSCKRRRITEEEKPSKKPSKDSLPFFLKSKGFEVLSRPPTTGSIEELDLELRLGDRPPKWYGLDISEKTQSEY